MPRTPQPSLPGARLRKWRKTHVLYFADNVHTAEKLANADPMRWAATQFELAAWLGVTERTVQRWETGRVPTAILRRCEEACP